MIAKRSKFFWIAIMTVVVSLTFAGKVAAHHGYDTTYDVGHPRTITGVIKAVRYANPHIRMQLQTTGDSKRVWRIDLPSPTQAQRRGLTRSFLKVGSTATVVGWPAYDGSNEMGASQITIGGKTVQVN
ncbi:hypothetical protein DP117_30900 [Brasilonema sp. UFV-L1]|nr:hypothetical protein [Brasilonema sp. UFV-L1]